jgi:hypothetical protein
MTEGEETRTYRYTELSPKAREKAIQEVREHKSEWLWDQPDADQLTEDFKEILYNTHGLGDEKHYTFEVYWNLAYSQGDGVCFEGQVDVGKFIQTQAKLTKSRELREYEKLIPFLHIVIKIPNSHYCHQNGMRVEVAFEGDEEGFDLLGREQRKEVEDWYYDMHARVRAWERVVSLIRGAHADPYAAHRVRLEEWEARRGKGKKAWIPEPMPVYDPTNLPPIPPEPPAPSEEPPKRLRRIMDRVKVEWKRLEDLSVEFEEHMKEKVSDISKELEAYGYKEIEYRSSDEFIDMELRESPTYDDLEFEEDGTLVD